MANGTLTRIRRIFTPEIWSKNLILLAVSFFLARFGEGVQNTVRTNFFIDTLSLSAGNVLWLEGLREIPGLTLIFVAALIMRIPLARRAAVSVFVMGIGYLLYAFVDSFAALVAVAVVASLGMHSWMPLHPSLALCLVEKKYSGRALGNLASVGALATIAGMGVIALISRLFGDLSIRGYYIAGGLIIIAGGFALLKIPASVGTTERAQPRMVLRRKYWLFYVLTFLQGSRKQVLGTFGVLVLVDVYGFELWQVSVLLLVSAVVNFLFAPYMGRMVDGLGERVSLGGSYTLLIVCCLLYAVINQVWILAVLLVVIKLLILVGMALNTYVNRTAPTEELTPTLSAGISINHVTSVLMPMVAGALLPIIGYRGIFLMAAGIIVVSLPFALMIKVEGRDRALDTAGAPS
jgi:predicted MFS family arabinose efflux permease